MGIRLTQTAPDRPIEILPDGKGDQALAQYIARLIQDDIKYKEARDKGGKVEKAVATITRDGIASPVSKSAAVAALTGAANTWEMRAREYSDRDLKQYTLEKAQAARQEIARLEGREIPEPEARRAVRPVTVTLPR